MKKALIYYAKLTSKVAGVEADTTSHKEKLLSAMGALVGILGVYGISQYFCPGEASFFIVASMGASAVLVFAVPHGALSQPWPVIGGNLVSALVGVGVASVLGHGLLAAMLAVGGAVLIMYYLRCLHPPGGATALLAVIGGPEIAALGFAYAFFPILLNASVMVAAGVVFNALIPWRTYPHGMAARVVPTKAAHRISVADIDHALQTLGSFTDISAEDLALIYERAEQHAGQRRAPRSQVARAIRRLKPGYRSRHKTSLAVNARK